MTQFDGMTVNVVTQPARSADEDLGMVLETLDLPTNIRTPIHYLNPDMLILAQAVKFLLSLDCQFTSRGDNQRLDIWVIRIDVLNDR